MYVRMCERSIWDRRREKKVNSHYPIPMERRACRSTRGTQRMEEVGRELGGVHAPAH
jgi:hypothetical protein